MALIEHFGKVKKMKAINKYRSTEKFLIGSVDVNHIIEIKNYFGNTLNSVAKASEATEENPFLYTVRTIKDGNITDYLLRICVGVEIIETKIIIEQPVN